MSASYDVLKMTYFPHIYSGSIVDVTASQLEQLVQQKDYVAVFFCEYTFTHTHAHECVHAYLATVFIFNKSVWAIRYLMPLTVMQ